MVPLTEETWLDMVVKTRVYEAYLKPHATETLSERNRYQSIGILFHSNPLSVDLASARRILK